MTPKVSFIAVAAIRAVGADKAISAMAIAASATIGAIRTIDAEEAIRDIEPEKPLEHWSIRDKGHLPAQ